MTEITPSLISLENQDHSHVDEISTEITSQMRIAVLLAIILPFVGLIAAIVLLWGVHFSWVHLAIMGSMYILTCLGITVGFHRLFTHRSFETNSVVKFVLAVLGSMAAEGPVLKWVAMHRHHHKHSDHEEDPHSPHLHGGGFKGFVKGLMHAHMGWLLRDDAPKLSRYVPDLMSDKVVRFVSKLFPLWVATGLIIPAVLGGLFTMSWTGVLLGFIWGGLTRLFLVHHVTWSINSVCHIWGSQDFRSHDHSKNNVVFGVLAMGEGWHNNHHAFPTSARHGLKWWQLDVSYLVIKGLEKLGLAWKVRVPGEEALAVKKIS